MSFQQLNNTGDTLFVYHNSREDGRGPLNNGGKRRRSHVLYDENTKVKEEEEIQWERDKETYLVLNWRFRPRTVALSQALHKVSSDRGSPL